jgi:hypothetical protein
MAEWLGGGEGGRAAARAGWRGGGAVAAARSAAGGRQRRRSRRVWGDAGEGGHDDGGRPVAAVVDHIAYGVGVGGTIRAAAGGRCRCDWGHQRRGKARQSRTNLEKAVGCGITRRRVAARGGNGEGHHRVEVVTIYKTPLEFLCRLY